jgi:polar amino acid transport system substrate-binding protein
MNWEIDMIIKISRRGMMLGTAALAAGAAAPAFADNHPFEGPNDKRLHAPGKLTVSTGDVVYPPWMMDDNPAGGKGFENEMIYALAAEMGFKKEDVVWVRETWDQALAPGNKNYDFAIQQITVSEERKSLMSFSDIYYTSDRCVVAMPGTALDAAKTFADLKKARWGAVLGTADTQYMETVIGLSDIKIFNDQAAVFQALQAKQIDGTVIEIPTALYVTGVQVPGSKILAMLPVDQRIGADGHGLLFQKDNPLIPTVNAGLAKLKEKGVIQGLVKTYLSGGDGVPLIAN